MLKLIFAIFGSLFFFIGCANKDVAQVAYDNGEYQKAYKIWEKWAKAGYANANLKLAKMALNQEISLDNDEAIAKAKQAYENGSIKAAFLLENLYIEQNNLQKAFEWMQKTDLQNANANDITNHLFLITTYLHNHQTQLYYLQQLEKEAQHNPTIAYKLGKFYAQEGIFQDKTKALLFLDQAYKYHNLEAGVLEAQLLLEANQKQKALDLLEKIAQQGNTKAFITLGKYSNKNKNYFLKEKNSPCISCSFQSSQQFFIKKEKLFQFNYTYIKNNVAIWFEKAYQLGDIQGMFSLIELDIQNDTYHRYKETFCHMDLPTTISYLQKLSTEYFKAKMLLAQLYIKYKNLQKRQLAKQIYLEYLQINQTDALWHLYLYAKEFEPQTAQSYLIKLLTLDFLPAKIEQAYYNLQHSQHIQSSLNLLISYAKQNNIKSLNYLAALKRSNSIHIPFKLCDLYKKICQLDPLAIQNDLHIASYYLQEQTIDKAATIYQFYANKNISQAQLALAKIYKNYCDNQKFLQYLQKAKEANNIQAQLLYAKLILLGEIKASSFKEALLFLQQQAQQQNVDAIKTLATAYSLGVTLSFNPQKALDYYQQLQSIQPILATKKMLTLYKQINTNHKYDEKIKQLYKKLYAVDSSYKIDYATYLISNNKPNKAKKLLLSLPLHQYDQADFLLYKLTQDKRYLKNASNSNNGNLLLMYSFELADKNPYKALLYAYRAALCNTQSTGGVIYELMVKINNPKTIQTIYNEAKTYPICQTN